MDFTTVFGKMITDLLAEDNQLIPYRKNLRSIINSIVDKDAKEKQATVTSTILLSQIIHRSKNKNHEPFYKFKEPCKHEKYSDGDSWIEELGFSRSEFDSALAVIGTKITRGESKDDAYKKRSATGLVIYWTDANRITYYHLNLETLILASMSIYLDKAEMSLYLEKMNSYFSIKRGNAALPSLSESPAKSPTKNKKDMRKKINPAKSSTLDSCANAHPNGDQDNSIVKDLSGDSGLSGDNPDNQHSYSKSGDYPSPAGVSQSAQVSLNGTQSGGVGVSGHTPASEAKSAASVDVSGMKVADIQASDVGESFTVNDWQNQLNLEQSRKPGKPRKTVISYLKRRIEGVSHIDAVTGVKSSGDLFVAIGSICGYSDDSRLWNGQMAKGVKNAVDILEKRIEITGKQITKEHIAGFLEYYQACDWRGKKGEQLKPAIIVEKWELYAKWVRDGKPAAKATGGYGYKNGQQRTEEWAAKNAPRVAMSTNGSVKESDWVKQGA